MVVEGEQVMVGDTGVDSTAVGYEVLCRRHHMRRMTSAAARATASAAGEGPSTVDACPLPRPLPA